MLVVFVFLGGQGLQARRAEYNEIGRVMPGPAGSDDTYLSRFGLSSALLDDALVDLPQSEQLVFVRSTDAYMFAEFSLLSYTTWPRRVYGVGCGVEGQPAYTDFAPPTARVNVAIVAAEHRPIGSETDVVQEVGTSTWLVHAPAGRTWASLCR